MDLGGGGDTKKSFFIPEYGHVAYQIIGNNLCNNRVAYILPADTTSSRRIGSKHFFSESSYVAYQIKGNGG